MDIKERLSQLRTLKMHPAWQIYQNMLKEKFDSTYSKLRKSRRDSAFYKIQGSLDTLDYAMNLLDDTIEEESNNPE